jgi:hypothetical protein
VGLSPQEQVPIFEATIREYSRGAKREKGLDRLVTREHQAGTEKERRRVKQELEQKYDCDRLLLFIEGDQPESSVFNMGARRFSFTATGGFVAVPNSAAGIPAPDWHRPRVCGRQSLDVDFSSS